MVSEIAEKTERESGVGRRTFLRGATAGVAGAVASGGVGRAAMAWSKWTGAADVEDLTAIRAEIEKRHEEAVARLQTWIRQPSIAAENRGINEGCELMMQFLREVGFQQVTKVPTEGQPGVFATLDAGAPKSVGLYFMYDVKQADPAEWSSPRLKRGWWTNPDSEKSLSGAGQ